MNKKALIQTLIVAAGFSLLAAAHPSAATTIDYNQTNEFGGPVNAGAPALPVTAAFVEAGGGAQHFSFAQALTAMVGPQLVDEEVAKLTKQYGKSAVHTWISGFNFAVGDALALATKAGIELPQPADLQGKKLAATLVTAGVDPKTNVYWAGLMYDTVLSHTIHNKVMADIDHKYGTATDLTVHRITNQAMYDLAHALGDTNVQLASLH